MFVLADISEGDCDDSSLPLPNNFIVTLADSKELILNLLESLPNMFKNSLDNYSCFTAAFKVTNAPPPPSANHPRPTDHQTDHQTVRRTPLHLLKLSSDHQRACVGRCHT